MRRFKKALRLLGLMVIIGFASLGVGLYGGIPLATNSRKKDTIEIAVESEDTDEDDSDGEEFKFGG